MAITVHKAGVSHAKSLIGSGDVDTSTAWSFSAADGNALLGENGDDWKNYGSMHLAVNSDADAMTKDHFKYPFGKGGKVYRSGLIAIRQRAGQQNETDIYDAAGRLLQLIDNKQDGRSMNEERRVVVGELRAVMEGDKLTKICGHAAKFDSLSENLGGFRERIAPGAFAKTITSADIRALWNHDANIVLGRNKSGTLRLSEDSAGLAYECDAPDTQLVRDMVMSPIARGDVNQCSFGFRTVSDKWNKVDGEWIRTLLEVELFDVSPVTYPAYASTDVAVRSLHQAQGYEAAPDDLWRMGLMARRLELEALL